MQPDIKQPLQSSSVGKALLVALIPAMSSAWLEKMIKAVRLAWV